MTNLDPIRPQTFSEIKRAELERLVEILYDNRWPNPNTWMSKAEQAFKAALTIIDLANRNSVALREAQNTFDKYSDGKYSQYSAEEIRNSQ